MVPLPPDVWAMRHPVPRTRLIGREREVDELLRLLRAGDDRLITITGPGGVGKTSLALHVALRAGASAGNRPAVTIELAAMTDTALVLPGIGTALGILESPERSWPDLIAGGLDDRPQLLVLDNCEHLRGLATVGAQLLDRCPSLRVLATSRAPLGIYGEREFPLAPLPVPEASPALPLADLARQPSVALFLRQAQLVDPSLELDRANARAIVDICRRLDGLPLAIELAAARVRTLPPEALRARLDRRFSVLTGGPADRPLRQRTLVNTIAWSYDLLDIAEQHLVRELAVCAGSWTLPAAEAIATTGSNVLEGIETLARHSLVRRRPHPAHLPGFTMLESLRAFGLERLIEHEELAAARDRHARYFAGLVGASARDLLLGTDQDRLLATLDWDIDNLRASLEWLYAGADIPTGLRMVSELAPYWELRGHWVEGRGWLERALRLADTAALDVRARLLLGSGVFALRQGDYTTAERRLKASRQLAHDVGDELSIALSDFTLGVLAIEQPSPDLMAGLTSFAMAESTFRRLGHRYWVGRTINSLGNVALARGDGAQAAAYFTEVLALAREFGTSWGIAGALGNLAEALLLQGELDRAEARLHESLAIDQGSSAAHQHPEALDTLALIACRRGHWVHAAQLWGAAESLRTDLGATVAASSRAVRAASIDAVRHVLGNTAFDEAWAEGRETVRSGTTADLLAGTSATNEATPPSTPAGHTGEPAAALTRRERDVLRLLAEGRSNQEIGAELFISPHTAAKHVANILAKLELDSRTAAAAWALRSGLVER
jgi:predicted ATPase/DNA-binding CsgD family transcriptional regulator